MFDKVLDDVGGFGLFQILVIALLFPPRMLLPCNFLLNNFIAAVPPHHCDVSSLDRDGLLGNLSSEQRLVVGVPVGLDGSLRSCEMFVEPQLQLLSNWSEGGVPRTVACQGGFVFDNSTFISTVATEVDVTHGRRMQTQLDCGLTVTSSCSGTLSATGKAWRRPPAPSSSWG